MVALALPGLRDTFMPRRIEPHHLATFSRPVRELFVDADKAAAFLQMALRSLKQLAREGRISTHPQSIRRRLAGVYSWMVGDAEGTPKMGDHFRVARHPPGIRFSIATSMSDLAIQLT
jgi:hypothetical protein